MADTATKRLNADERRVRDNQADADKLIAKNSDARDAAKKAVADARALIRENAKKLKLLSDLISTCGGKPSPALVEELETMAEEEASEKNANQSA